MSGHITQSEQHKSKQFMTLITGLMDCVEAMAQHAPEGEYLKAMNLFKDLYDQHTAPINNIAPEVLSYTYMMRQVVHHNAVINQHDRRTRMRLKRTNKLKNDADKLAAGWKICKHCDRLIAKGGMAEHKLMDVCVRTKDTKLLTKTIELEETGRYFAITTKIKHALKKVGRTSITNNSRDSGYWLKGTYDERAAEE